MAEAQPTSYDEVPYASQVFYYSHPDRLATMARLFGMRPAPLDQCRVLELGCGTGSNLIPMACALPEARFLGIDLSARQIDMGREVVQHLGLANIDLRPLSILDVDEGLGRFDYIICHGVYSWVPVEVQDKILSLCRQFLAPEGIAYVSYNTYPGWHRRSMIREMMRFHVRQFTDPAERVQQARAMLDFVIECVGDPKSAYGVSLKAEADQLTGTADSYIYHEHLEENNHPVYFHEFARRAADHGLQYLAEAQPTPLAHNLSPRATAILEQVSVDLIHGEQYLDFVRNRTFRRSLLCHAEVALSRPASPQALLRMHLTTLVKRLTEKPDLRSSAKETFSAEDDTRVCTNNPLLKAALLCLWESWPQAVSFAELWLRVRRRLAEEAPDEQLPAEDEGLALAEPLLQCFLSKLVELHVQPARFVREPSGRPVASPLARYQASYSGEITNLRHRTVLLNEFERQVLVLLDGKHAPAGILEVLWTALDRGDLEIQQEGQTVTDPGRAREIVREALPPILQRLARLALLVS
jgi:methyltransferase-like protein/SAM-dependent methyltransferase